MPCERMHDRKPQRQTLAWPAPKKHELRRQRPRQRQEIAEHAPQKCGLTLAETNTIPTSPDTQEKKSRDVSGYQPWGFVQQCYLMEKNLA